LAKNLLTILNLVTYNYGIMTLYGFKIQD
jgi:hypothetical protein